MTGYGMPESRIKLSWHYTTLTILAKSRYLLQPMPYLMPFSHKREESVLEYLST
jgi:hypothetical protein